MLRLENRDLMRLIRLKLFFRLKLLINDLKMKHYMSAMYCLANWQYLKPRDMKLMQ